VRGAVVCQKVRGLFDLFIAHLTADELSLREASNRSGYHLHPVDGARRV
jgi:hypothetical protein